MYILKMIGIVGAAALSSWVPQLIFLPYGLIAWGVSQGYNSWLLVGLGAAGGLLGSMLLWMLDARIDPWIQKHFRRSSGSSSLPKWLDRIFSLHKKIHKKWVWLVIVFCAVTSPVPDVVTVRYVRKKIPWRWFAGVVVIAKFFVYFPFVFGMERLTRYVSL